MKNKVNVLEILEKLLKATESAILSASHNKYIGGSCVCILVIHNNYYYIANVGDSRIIKMKLRDNRTVHQLTTDHKPENPHERKRI